MKHSNELGKLLKELENRDIERSCIGKVVKAPPNLEISIWNGEVVLSKENLYMNDRLFNDHTRLYKVEDGISDEIKIDGNIDNTISSSAMTPSGEGPHTHDIKSTKGTTKIDGKGSFKEHGTIVFTDTLKVGDLVKLTPSEDSQIWFVDYKVRKI